MSGVFLSFFFLHTFFFCFFVCFFVCLVCGLSVSLLLLTFRFFELFIFFMLETRYDMARYDKRFQRSHSVSSLPHSLHTSIGLNSCFARHSKIDSVIRHVIALSNPPTGGAMGGLCNTNFTLLPPGAAVLVLLTLGMAWGRVMNSTDRTMVCMMVDL